MLVYQRVNHINLAEELSEINRNTPFGAALWGNGRSRATIINQYMQGYVVCLVSKCIPKPMVYHHFSHQWPLHGIFRMRQPRPQWYGQSHLSPHGYITPSV